MVYSPSLDEIVEAWRESTKKKYPEDHPMRKLLSQQGQYIGKAGKAIDVRYSPIAYLPGEPWSDIAMFYNNNSTTERSLIYESTEEIGATATTILEKSLEIGAEVKVETEFPGMLDMKAKISMKGGKIVTDPIQHTTKDTKKLRIPFKAPAHTKVSTQAFATRERSQINWTGNVAVGGVWSSSYYEGHNSTSASFFLPGLIAQAQLEGFIEVPGWHSCTKTLDEQKEFWGEDWPYGDMLKNVAGSASIPFVWGEMSGTMTYERFVDIKINVNELGPADSAEPTSMIANYAADSGQDNMFLDTAQIYGLEDANLISIEECGFLLESLLTHMAQKLP